MWVAEICRIKTGTGALPIAGIGVRKLAPTPLRLSNPLLLFFLLFFSHLEWSGKGFFSDLFDIQNDFCCTLLHFRQCCRGLLHTGGREGHAWTTPAWGCNTPWCNWWVIARKTLKIFGMIFVKLSSLWQAPGTTCHPTANSVLNKVMSLLATSGNLCKMINLPKKR